MVAKINTGKNISKALNYNEKKVQEGKAEIIASSGFIKEMAQLTFYDKLYHFQNLTTLNERTVTNTLHVSLNFDPSEKLTKEQLIKIAETYMQKIGFENQPYLVYKHEDAGHPHIHIVSTNIQSDGSRISMHNLGRNQSERARKEIENIFGLVKADNQRNASTFKLAPVNAQKVVYGKQDTRRAIANVLLQVLNQYKYSSLPELNAVLKLYNVVADRGAENSRMFRYKGLVYRVINEKGEKVGTPLKASAFYLKPTLTFLEEKFTSNNSLKEPHKKRLQSAINWALVREPKSLEIFIKEMEKEQISVVLRTGKKGVLYGITFVDHKTKTVFNGSDLGKNFSAKAIVSRMDSFVVIENAGVKEPNKFIPIDQRPENEYGKKQLAQQKTDESPVSNFLSPTPTIDYIPHQFKKKRKKRKKQLSI